MNPNRPRFLFPAVALALAGALIVWLISLPPASAPTQAAAPTPPAVSPARAPHASTRTMANQSTEDRISAILEETDEEARLSLAMDMSEHASYADVDVLMDILLHAENAELLRGAQLAVARHADAAVSQRLADKYETAPSDTAAASLAVALESSRREESLPVLAKILHSKHIPLHDRLSMAALRALHNIGTPAAVNTLAERLDATEDVKEQATMGHALATSHNLGNESQLANIALGHTPWKKLPTRQAALKALATSPSPLLKSTLEKLSNDPNSEMQAAAR